MIVTNSNHYTKNKSTLLKTLVCLISLISLCSCSFYTELTYRQNRREQYIKENGYMLDVERYYFSIGQVLIIGTYTPNSWDEGFYYGYLEGLKSDSNVTITNVELEFPETKDTLHLHEIRDKRTYIFTSPQMEEILDRNKSLKVNITLYDSIAKMQKSKEYILSRHKHTYPTGTFPHTF